MINSNRRGRIAILMLLLAIVGTGVWLRYTLQQAAITPGPSSTMQDFEVKQGSSLRAVLYALQRQQLIGSARKMEWYLRCCNRKLATGASVKAGRYRIVPGQPPVEILRQLIEGRVLLEKVTILEGWMFSQMRELLEKQAGLKQTVAEMTEAQIMATLGAPGVAAEGRFAPDTYSYASGVTTDLQVLNMAFQAQQRYLQEAWEKRQQNLPLATPDEALTLASIIEKETGLASERALVAGVFINRLRKGMRLETDPTVIYGMRDRYDGNIRRSDLRRDSPYNTYTREGLPPTPIALPGRKAIKAALNPEKTDAIFFMALGDGSGGHHFSATLSEHLNAQREYLERLRAPSVEEVISPDTEVKPAAATTPAQPTAPAAARSP